ncbi:MAG: FAD-binding oxidoreductase [Eubacteriales bacterium]|nr:FAD-binding oxidoreductase [Eubacteriales bacterium]
MRQLTHTLELKAKEVLSPDSYLLKFKAGDLAGQFTPGQFLEADCGGYIFRPFGLMHQDPVAGELWLGVKVVGESSRFLVELPLGAKVEVHAPLGRGFQVANFQEILAVGGGSGIFPLYEVLKTSAQEGKSTHLVCGFRSEAEAYPRQLFSTWAQELYFSSDQGGLDFTGHAGACLDHFFAERTFRPQTLLIACGPLPLLRYVRDFAQARNLACQLSLEENMACGLGLCAGCSIDIRNEKGELDRVRCCVEGPVFPGNQVVFPGDPYP